MKPTYSLQWLTNKFDAGEHIKYIFFWGHTNKTNEVVGKFCFSQWFELPFTVDGVVYWSTEHWMMAHKALLFEDYKTHSKIIKATSPAEAKKLGREVMGFDEQIWLANRYEIVINGNIHKFNQNPQFAEYLVNTSDRVLVEASPADKIWGIGMAQNDEGVNNPYYWGGLNLLGFALMETRDFLIKYGHFENPQHQFTPPWTKYPTTDPLDMFWRMGTGEDLIVKFSQYYGSLDEKDQTILRLNYPTPYLWRDFYAD